MIALSAALVAGTIVDFAVSSRAKRRRRRPGQSRTLWCRQNLPTSPLDQNRLPIPFILRIPKLDSHERCLVQYTKLITTIVESCSNVPDLLLYIEGFERTADASPVHRTGREGLDRLAGWEIKIITSSPGRVVWFARRRTYSRASAPKDLPPSAHPGIQFVLIRDASSSFGACRSFALPRRPGGRRRRLKVNRSSAGFTSYRGPSLFAS